MNKSHVVVIEEAKKRVETLTYFYVEKMGPIKKILC